MRKSLIVTVIGEDRPGIVEQLSDQVLAGGANWEESRMARLAGKFAGILRVSVEAAGAQQLATGLATLEAMGLKVIAEWSTAEPADLRTIALELVGHDRPGIVREISRVLAHHGVNIEELETEITSAAMSGDRLFRARARMAVPSNMTLPELRGLLEPLADDLMVDIVVNEGE
jgi:glycine cleavage system regulatory protein